MLKIPTRGLYVLTDYINNTEKQLLETTETILAAGINLLQYRNKKVPENTRVRQAMDLKRLCSQYHVPLIINDDLELAKCIHAEGVHLGKNDPDCQEARGLLGDDYIIGISCYNDLQRAATAENNGADYVAFGSFYQSATKPDAVTASVNLLREAAGKITIPVVAIGGITPRNAAILLQEGAQLLAVSQSLYNSPDPAMQVNQFNRLFRDIPND